MEINIGIEKRKISRAGDSLHATLPVSWVKTFGLKNGDDVKVVYDNLLLIMPESVRRDKDSIIKELSLLIEAGLIHEKALKEKKRR